MRLIDADELITEICREECERKFEDCTYQRCLSIKAVQAAPTVGCWISVKDRLPEGFQKVLVFWYANGEPMVDTAFWSNGHSTEYWEGVEITHWMPLPEPPEVKA